MFQCYKWFFWIYSFARLGVGEMTLFSWIKCGKLVWFYMQNTPCPYISAWLSWLIWIEQVAVQSSKLWLYFPYQSVYSLHLWCKEPGYRFNIKMSYRYRKSHCGDRTVVRSSYLHNRISFTGKMTSLYWIRAQGISSCGFDLISQEYS